MLVLTRKVSESVTVKCCGHTLNITLSKIRQNGEVKIAFDGPMAFHIKRGELEDETQRVSGRNHAQAGGS